MHLVGQRRERLRAFLADLFQNADYDAKFGVDARAIGNFIRVVYRSLN